VHDKRKAKKRAALGWDDLDPDAPSPVDTTPSTIAAPSAVAGPAAVEPPAPVYTAEPTTSNVDDVT